MIKNKPLTTNIASVGNDTETSKRSDYMLLGFCFVVRLKVVKEKKERQRMHVKQERVKQRFASKST